MSALRGKATHSPVTPPGDRGRREKGENRLRVVLLEDVKGSGTKGTVLDVKDGYARNYLLRKGLARVVTAAVERELADAQNRAQAREERERSRQQAIHEGLNGQVVEIAANVGEQGRLFGAVTHADVAQAIAKLGFSVDKKRVEMEPIKHVGQHQARLHLYPGMDTEIIVRVVAQ